MTHFNQKRKAGINHEMNNLLTGWMTEFSLVKFFSVPAVARSLIKRCFFIHPVICERSLVQGPILTKGKTPFLLPAHSQNLLLRASHQVSLAGIKLAAIISLQPPEYVRSPPHSRKGALC